MDIDTRIDSINQFSFQTDAPEKTVRPATESFDSLFNAAIDVINETNQYQLRANQLQTDLATGSTDDIMTVLMAQDRAYSTLNFTVTVTNKIIESYREIMRMQL